MKIRGTKAFCWGLLVAMLSGNPAGAESATPLTTVRFYPPDASASQIYRPLFVGAPPGDTTRLFVVQQRLSAAATTQGRIRVLNKSDGTIIGTSFLDTSGQNSGNEEGLLGLAFHPDYFADAPNVNRGAFFIYITQGGNNHVYRYTATGQDPMANTADASSAQLVLTLNHPSFSNHNGGWIGFGPDGYLYIATGDGGSSCDPSGNGQSINSLLGKMLRLNVAADQNPGNTTIWGYTNPPDNPFVGVAGLDEIYHYGLRNPWRCSFDRVTGNLYMGDVGQNAREEISLAPAGVGGLNFGWDIREGFQCSNIASSNCTSTCSTTGRLNPVWDYVYTNGSAVTGGYVYRGDKIPDLKGTYFFANYNNGLLSSFAYAGSCPGPTFQCSAVTAGQVTNRTAELTPTGPVGGLSISSITSFGEDGEGELYIVDQNGGEIFKIVVNCAGSSLAISDHPDSVGACEGETVILSVAAGPLLGAETYTWRRGVNVVGGNEPTLVLSNVSAADAGDYTCTVEDQCDNVVSNIATVTVSVPQVGDVSGNCIIDLGDLPLFADVLIGVDTDAGHVARSDINGVDGPDGADIQGFIDLLVP